MRRFAALLFCATMIATPAAASPVSVLYAGSLVNLMEHGLFPAFAAASGDTPQGAAAGSNGLANQIKGKLRQGDVFISANPRVNDTLAGEANGDWVRWYVTFAQSPLVIGYNPASRFAAELQTKPWYEVLQMPGIKIGRTDAKLDPKGALTLQLLAKAEAETKLPGLAAKVLGADDNPEQVLPEETLVGRLQSGQLDAGFFYSTETTDLKIPAIALPPAMTLNATYTVTVLRDAPHQQAAISFVRFLLGPDGQAIMHAHGLNTLPPRLTGDTTSVPEAIAGGLSAPK
jgi:molybdate/tungstate transport system substrate-binding protein